MKLVYKCFVIVPLLAITIRTDAEFAQNDNYSAFQPVQSKTENKNGEITGFLSATL